VFLHKGTQRDTGGDHAAGFGVFSPKESLRRSSEKSYSPSMLTWRQLIVAWRPMVLMSSCFSAGSAIALSRCSK
jgi:hypothetical protein